MTVLENIELQDIDFRESLEPQVPQRIKLRDPSYNNISAYFANFLAQCQANNVQLSDIPFTPMPEASAINQAQCTVTEIVAMNPKLYEMLILLAVSGKFKSEGLKALKIRPSMLDNMKKNGMGTSIVPEEKEVKEQDPDVVVDFTQELVPSDQNGIKISRNEATAAKLEKYVDTTEEMIQDSTVVAVSPTVIEATSAREISRTVPIVAPTRLVEEEKRELVLEPKKVEEERHSLNITNVSILDGINDLATLREYLSNAARLKQAAEEAHQEALAAKKEAQEAASKAENSRSEMLRTAEMVAAHQERLLDETEKSRQEVTMYNNQRGEYETQTAEYKKAIDDMLAIMGNDEQTEKGKTM